MVYPSPNVPQNTPNPNLLIIFACEKEKGNGREEMLTIVHI